MVLRGWKGEKYEKCGMETSHSKRQKTILIANKKKKEEGNMRLEKAGAKYKI